MPPSPARIRPGALRRAKWAAAFKQSGGPSSLCDECKAYRCQMEAAQKKAELFAWAHDEARPVCEEFDPDHYMGLEGVRP